MKTSIIDYVLCSLFITLLFGMTCLISLELKRALFDYLRDFSILATILLFIGTYGLLTALLLRLLNRIIPFRIGAYSMADSQFTLWKIHAVIGALGRSCLSLFLPIFLRPVYYSLFGASIGTHTAIGGKILDPLLTRIEDYAILGESSIIAAHVMTHDSFFLAQITVEKKATIGIGVIIMPGVVIGENSIVLPGSLVTMGTQIPPNEVWGGSPARKINDVEISNSDRP